MALIGTVSGSLTNLADGSAYLRAGTGISLTTGSNGQVTVALATSADYYNVADSSYQMSATNKFVGVDTSIGACVITLPSGSSLTAGSWFVVKDEYGLANSSYITINTQGTDALENGTSTIINLSMGSRSFYYAGSGKFYQW